MKVKIPETLEASLMLVTHVMSLLGIPGDRVFQAIQEVRKERYQLLHGHFIGGDTHADLNLKMTRRAIHPIYLPTGSYAVNKGISELKLHEFKVLIQAIRRGNTTIQSPTQQVTIESGDIIILNGTSCDIEAAEAYLLMGA